MTKTKTALILYGGWEGHQPTETTGFFKRELEDRGFSVSLTEDLAALEEEESLQGYDLIIPNWTMGKISNPQAKGFERAIEAGSGLAGWHGGMGDAFRGCTRFLFMTGGQFVAHPGNVVKYSVNIVDHDHPVTQGLGDFEMESEQYYLHTDPDNHGLATSIVTGIGAPWVRGVVMTVVWTRKHGEGKVFYCALGHRLEDFEVPECRAIISRGLAWAAR